VIGFIIVVSFLIRYFLGCANFFFYGESITDYFNGNPNPQVDDASEVSLIPHLLSKSYFSWQYQCLLKHTGDEN